MRRVVITGLGAVTPLGVGMLTAEVHEVQRYNLAVPVAQRGVRQSWKRLLRGDCGIVSTRHLGPEYTALPSQVAGLVPEGSRKDGKWKATNYVTTTEARQAAKFTQYALAASEEALEDAGFKDGNGLEPDMTGVCLGSGIGNLQELYDTSLAYNQAKNYRKIHPLFVPRLLINLGAGHVSMRYGFKGPNHAVTTACTTGAHSIGDAMRFIAFGDADVMLAGGAESCIHPLAIGGFSRSRSLVTNFNDTPELSSRPFDQYRAGFVISEGAAVLILEELEHAKRRGARIYAELAGYGTSADAYHLTAPQEQGSGAELAMRKALKNAQLRPAEVDYINAHATSTPLGDAAENMAIKSVMLGADGKPKSGDINISSIKGAIGHLLGAAGAVEALFTALAVAEDVMPPTLNCHSQTEEFNCNYVANAPQTHSVNVALTNSFGFGGTNASLCLRKL